MTAPGASKELPIELRVKDPRQLFNSKRWALGPGDARRGIVLMTVLGSCRAQEMDRR